MQQIRPQLRTISQIVFVLCLGMLLPQVTEARGKTLHIDTATSDRGYTVTVKSFSVGLPPNTLHGEGYFTVRPKRNYPELPSYLEAVSEPFYYQIDLTTPAYSAKPFWLSYTAETAPEHRRNVYYYDSRLEEWRALPTRFSSDSKTVKAAWHFPGSLVVVADDKRYGFGPQQTDAYRWLGDVSAASAIVIDVQTGKQLYGKNTTEVRSLASLTKLMTAYVVVNRGVDWNKLVTYRSYHNQIGSSVYLQDGEVLSVRDLLFALTVRSANNAAYALVETTGLSLSDFINEMNATARSIGMTRTHFADPSGLNPANTSTVEDYALFMRHIASNFSMFQLTATPAYGFTTRNTSRYYSFANTTKLFTHPSFRITSTKTGYIDEALYNQAIKTKRDNKEVITVLFGAPTSQTRFAETVRLTDWAYDNFNW